MLTNGSANYSTKIGAAFAILSDYVSLAKSSGCSSNCFDKFSKAANSLYRDLLSTVRERGTPPVLLTPRRTVVSAQRPSVKAFTPKGQDTTFIIFEDVMNKFDLCDIASLIMHELIHEANLDGTNGQRVERSDWQSDCSFGCVQPARFNY